VTLDDAFTNLDTLETPRLRVRPLEESDAEALFEIKSDPEVTMKYCLEPDESIEDTRIWVDKRLEDYTKRDVTYWVFALKESDRAIGGCCFWNFDPTLRCAEIGYELHRAYWNKGFTSEALSAVLTYGFTGMDLHRIEALPLAFNTPSVKLLIKLGFRLEGTIRERVFFRGRFEDQLIFGLLKDELINKKDPNS
jgi:[ribosomal protein S5]-alanine N-acetyltransferase